MFYIGNCHQVMHIDDNIISFVFNFKGAASMTGRKVTVLRQAGAACDHPVDPAYPEGRYLSNYLLRVT